MFGTDPNNSLESERKPDKDEALRSDERIRRVRVLKSELFIEQISRLNGDESIPFRQAVTQGSIQHPEIIAILRSAARRWINDELSVLIDVSSF